MTVTPTTEELYTYISRVFDTALEDADFKSKVQKHTFSLKVITTDPDGVLIIDLGSQSVFLGDGSENADATLRMSSDSANRFWQGEMNLLGAVTRGQVKLQGNKTALVKSLPLARQLSPTYIACLRNDGRSDLLVSA